MACRQARPRIGLLLMRGRAVAEDKYLYQELKERLRAKDKEGAIEAYYQLLSEGRPLSEIIAAVPTKCGKSSTSESNGGDELLDDGLAPAAATSELTTRAGSSFAVVATE